jgi:hypothetical protein
MKMPRSSAHRVLLFGLLAATLSNPQPTWAKARKPIVAVFDIQSRGARLSRRQLSRLSDYLSAQLAATAAFQLVPRDKLKRRLTKQKRASYRNCYRQSCQIAIGQELAAQKSLATTVMRLGRRCTVSTTLFDLKKAASEAGASVTGKCSISAITASIDAIVKKLRPGGGQTTPIARPAGPAAHLMAVRGHKEWILSFQLRGIINAKELFFKVAPNGHYKSTGHHDHLNMKTGLPMPKLTIMLPLTQTKTSLTIKAIDVNGRVLGPHKLAFEPKRWAAKQAKRYSLMQSKQWISMRPAGNKVLVTFTGLLAYHYGIREIRYSLNSKKLDRRFPSKPINYSDPTSYALYAPNSTQSVAVQVVYGDGSQSPIHTFRR